MSAYYQQLTDAASLRLERGRAADAARWAAMAEYYQQRYAAPGLNRAQAAEAARWEAMAAYYQDLAESRAQNLGRGRAADSARWTAMAEYYQLISTIP
jgi:hypothetical protein